MLGSRKSEFGSVIAWRLQAKRSWPKSVHPPLHPFQPLIPQKADRRNFKRERPWQKSTSKSATDIYFRCQTKSVPKCARYPVSSASGILCFRKNRFWLGEFSRNWRNCITINVGWYERNLTGKPNSCLRRSYLQEAKNALKVFGHLRHMNHADEIPVEKEEPPQQIPVQELPLLDRPSAQMEPAATLDDLAKGVVLRMPLLDQMSHTEMHKRLSLSELEKGLQSPIAETNDEPFPKRRHKYQRIMEEEARIDIESPQLNPENSVMEVNSESRQSAGDIPGKEVTAKTTRSWILSELKNDPSNPASQGDGSSKVPVENRMKRSIVANEEKRTDRTELDRYLRRRFRILYNPVPVDEEYGDVLEVLKFRAFNKLKESAKEEEERLQAARDPARINDTACQLVSDVENILVDARKNMNASVSISGPPVDQERLCELKDLKKEEIKKRLLLEAKGLPRTPLTFMDSKTKALAYQVKRLKSALHLQAPDIRKCRSSSSSIAPSYYRSERSATSKCHHHGLPCELVLIRPANFRCLSNRDPYWKQETEQQSA
ncbi:hypothetical protein RvY_15795 [Ramazzottius varieornatus]|uniref:Uncharacterized protein n=1 Tax=Ramazzottius varieornatus TaxID=947166 RepID=A0A1D1VZ85_RAMVA|nr:hypothetical protein RvY_15795 [Ramazzottius varieornatus]